MSSREVRLGGGASARVDQDLPDRIDLRMTTGGGRGEFRVWVLTGLEALELGAALRAAAREAGAVTPSIFALDPSLISSALGEYLERLEYRLARAEIDLELLRRAAGS